MTVLDRLIDRAAPAMAGLFCAQISQRALFVARDWRTYDGFEEIEDDGTGRLCALQWNGMEDGGAEGCRAGQSGGAV